MPKPARTRTVYTFYPNPVEWRTTRAVHSRYLDLARRLATADEGSDAWYSLTDEIRSLPGFPKDFHPTQTLVPVVTDETH